jgi:hypothetical protein
MRNNHVISSQFGNGQNDGSIRKIKTVMLYTEINRIISCNEKTTICGNLRANRIKYTSRKIKKENSDCPLNVSGKFSMKLPQNTVPLLVGVAPEISPLPNSTSAQLNKNVLRFIIRNQL